MSLYQSIFSSGLQLTLKSWPVRLCEIWPLPTSLTSFPTIFPYTSWATVAFLLSWEHPKHDPAPGHSYMLFPSPRIHFPLDSLRIHGLTPFRPLSSIISSQRPFLITPRKKHSHHFIVFGVLIITCQCMLFCIVYCFIICRSTGIEKFHAHHCIFSTYKSIGFIVVT